MKQIFTLSFVIALTLISHRSFSQINEHFEYGISSLTSNCWILNDVMPATIPSSFVINENGSLYTEPPVNNSNYRNIATPRLTVGDTINVSFNYRLSANLNGQATRTIQLDLTDDTLNTVQTLTSFNVANNATSNILFSQSFTVTTPGSYRLVVRLGGNTGAGNVRFSFDDLYVSANPQPCMLNSTLPVKLTRFQGNLNNDKISLQWAVSANETTGSFIVEKSFDGINFRDAALVFGSEKTGSENYAYYEIFHAADKVFYRLKMYDRSQMTSYSNILVFQTKAKNDKGIRIMSNPVADKLTFSFQAEANQKAALTVLDMSGRVQIRQYITAYKGSNLLSLPLPPAFARGIYIVELSTATNRFTGKFVKQE